LTPNPSFGHNLCFRCLNEQCEPILDIYIPRSFQWYRKRHNPLNFDPSNRSLKFRESTGSPSPKVGVALGVWGFTPSHFLTLSGACDVTPGLLLGPQPCNPFVLVTSPRLGLRHFIIMSISSKFFFQHTNNKYNLWKYVVNYIWIFFFSWCKEVTLNYHLHIMKEGLL